MVDKLDNSVLDDSSADSQHAKLDSLQRQVEHMVLAAALDTVANKCSGQRAVVLASASIAVENLVLKRTNTTKSKLSYEIRRE